MTEAGSELDVRMPPDDPLPETLRDHDAVVCLGGGMNAEDDTRHPWLARIRSLLNEAVREDAAALCVCLGAQLLAVAEGGQVRLGRDGPEVGPSLVAKKDAAWIDPLFAELPLMQDVLQFHADEISTLPETATLLGSSPRYPHQAFRIGKRVYGTQFHIETTREVVQHWAAKSKEKAAQAAPDAFDDDRLTRLHADIEETWRPFAHRFVELAAGRLEPARPERPTLPLL